MRKDWTGGGPWDLGYQPFTKHDAQREARRLNEEHPDYNHEAVHITWPRKRS